MDLRSMLFVPGDSERKLAKGESCGADALVLDLEDSVPRDRIETARSMVREFLGSHRDRSRQQLWVRVNPLSTDKALADLAAITGSAPHGIMLPKADSGADVVVAGHYLSALEVREGLRQGSIRIFAVATETAPALFALGTFADAARAWRASPGAPRTSQPRSEPPPIGTRKASWNLLIGWPAPYAWPGRWPPASSRWIRCSSISAIHKDCGPSREQQRGQGSPGRSGFIQTRCQS